MSKEDFEKRYDELFPAREDIYKIIVIVEKSSNWIVGCGTLFFEKKFLRNIGTVSSFTHSISFSISHLKL